MLDLIGTPWAQVSCVGLVNAALPHLPNLDGSKWGRVLPLPTVPWHKRRSGDLILWRHHNGMLIPCHVGILLNADENYVIHSGYTGRRPEKDWERFSSVHIFQLQRLSDRGTVLRVR